MNFMLMQSLEHISLVSVAALLWNQHDVRTLVAEFTNSPLFLKLKEDLCFGFYVSTERKEKWREIEEKVIEKVPQLMITTILKEKILGFIQAVGLQILNWMQYHRSYCRFDFLHLPNQFFWTPQGIVDKKKTAEMLVRDERIDIGTRYKFACIYCLENDIRKLWNTMPKFVQKFLFNEEKMGNNMLTDLLTFWRMYLHGEVAKFGSVIRRSLNHKCSTYRYLFRSAAGGGNKAATEYFLQKIFPRKKSLFKTALYVNKLMHVDVVKKMFRPRIIEPPREYYSEVFCFLLSQINDQQQVKIFKKLPPSVLRCFLDWPWQNFFLNVVSRMWSFLKECYYHCLLSIVIHKVIFRCTDYNYQNMFRELWQQAPHYHKRCMMHYYIGNLLGLLLEINDKESLKLVVQDATLSEKNALIFGSIGRNLCEERIHQPDLLKFFIQLFISSKDEMIKFKQEREQFYIERRMIRIRGHKRAELFKVLDDLVRAYDKRKNVDGGDSSAPKRICNINFNDMTHDANNLKRRRI